MTGSSYMIFKLVFEVPTGRILGAQAIGKGNTDKRIDVIAAMINHGRNAGGSERPGVVLFSGVRHGQGCGEPGRPCGAELLDCRYRQVPVSEVRGLVESGAFIVDVREEQEFQAGHLKNAHNIPLSQLRQRMQEIPRDIPVYVHCRTGQRSYNAVCCLQGHGYQNLWNISGSYLGVSLYEYFNDRTEGREPVVTEYNFN